MILRRLTTFYTALALLACFAPSVMGSALTTTVGPNEKLCFYADVDKEGEKIGFYFAVQAGGSFDIDFSVLSPAGTVILAEDRAGQGDFIFTANIVGEYSFCFENDMSTITHKLIDFDIMVESEPRREAPARAGQISDKTSALEESVYRLRHQLGSIERVQRHFHTRETRGFSVVQSTLNRLYWYAILDSIAVVAMAATQVYVLQTFFTATGRKYKV